MCIKRQSIPVFPDKLKIADFRLKKADVSRAQGVCHVIYVFFGSPPSVSSPEKAHREFC